MHGYYSELLTFFLSALKFFFGIIELTFVRRIEKKNEIAYILKYLKFLTFLET